MGGFDEEEGAADVDVVEPGEVRGGAFLDCFFVGYAGLYILVSLVGKFRGE